MVTQPVSDKKNGQKEITWRGMGEILKPFEGNRGADVIIATTKPHKDYGIIPRCVLESSREACLAYLHIEALIEEEMFDELAAFMYSLELTLAVKGIGLSAFIQAFTGIYSEKGMEHGVKKGIFAKKKDKEAE